MDDRLYRSTTDRSLTGVCGGLAAWLGLDPSLVRVAWVLLTLASGGIFLLVYIVMAVVVPGAPSGWAPRGRMRQPGPPPPDAGPTTWPGGWEGAPATTGGGIRADRAGIVVGGALIVLGVWFLVQSYIPVNWDLVWPVAVIALGALLILGAVRRQR